MRLRLEVEAPVSSIEPEELAAEAQSIAGIKARSTAKAGAAGGAGIAGVLAGVDPDVLFWALWGALAVGGTLSIFAVREVRTFLGPGRTLSEVTEAAIAARPVLWWTLLAAMSTLCVGWPLLTVHWYTGIL